MSLKEDCGPKYEMVVKQGIYIVPSEVKTQNWFRLILTDYQKFGKRFCISQTMGLLTLFMVLNLTHFIYSFRYSKSLTCIEVTWAIGTLSLYQPIERFPGVPWNKTDQFYILLDFPASYHLSFTREVYKVPFSFVLVQRRVCYDGAAWID